MPLNITDSFIPVLSAILNLKVSSISVFSAFLNCTDHTFNLSSEPDRCLLYIQTNFVESAKREKSLIVNSEF